MSWLTSSIFALSARTSSANAATKRAVTCSPATVVCWRSAACHAVRAKTAALRALVRAAKGRWRVEHDYRELKQALGLAHFEGRTWPGWHHHVVLVSIAHAFVTTERLAPKAGTPG
ncbi:hypothetical protein Ppa06_64460 [Planomonospora parontospora subsp. parontospora]|uniref:Transposase IS4-like domain-containing protein n=2 Tax=Planomonospora parontospora TaxID=58119 RepID=A0AA37BMM2_9ACTN|nr:hypothetical protein GCM10010126_61920 [Planomonospora parontospora]GII12648.1 hypothetical protein Ppa06_64460 [Planomonospora parontospora subsp. parontospora]